MTNAERMIGETGVDAPVRRTWEPMTLVKVGAFEDMLRGPSGMGKDANGKME
jgi:hypothetical protein